jgi:hypothetical protein
MLSISGIARWEVTWPPPVAEYKGSKVEILNEKVWFSALNKSQIIEPIEQKFNKWLWFY